MGKSLNAASLKYILLPLLCLVLRAGMVGTSPKCVHAQHQVDPESWIEMRKMFRPEGPTPTIEEDIAALAGPGAKRAGPRLIDRGPEALHAVHAALRSDEVELLKPSAFSRLSEISMIKVRCLLFSNSSKKTNKVRCAGMLF